MSPSRVQLEPCGLSLILRQLEVAYSYWKISVGVSAALDSQARFSHGLFPLPSSSAAFSSRPVHFLATKLATTRYTAHTLTHRRIGCF